MLVKLGITIVQGCQWGEYGQSCACSLYLETLLVVMSHTTQQQDKMDTMPLQTIMTTEKRCLARGPLSCSNSKHDRDDQCDLYDCGSQGENERAERLSDPVRHNLGVVNRGENGGNENRPSRGRRAPAAPNIMVTIMIAKARAGQVNAHQGGRATFDIPTFLGT